MADPYRIWLSEVMLQQTTVAAVKPYFEKFTNRWPTVQALAAADDADIMAEWAGLGYYSRARNLVACAREVARRGGFPDNEDDLRGLPGLGAYTAAAVAAIGFGRRAVVVDANVERVVARLFVIDDPLPGARTAIRAAANRITPARRAGDFAQAMMDLGATICTSRAPRCLLCPLSDPCGGRAMGDPERLPVKPPKKAKPQRKGRVWWIERSTASGPQVWLVRRGAAGMLGGMRALPDDGWTARDDGSGSPPVAGPWRSGGIVRHSFTHCDLELSLAVHAGNPGQNDPALNDQAGEWWPVATIEKAGLPTLFAKAARMAVASRAA